MQPTLFYLTSLLCKHLKKMKKALLLFCFCIINFVCIGMSYAVTIEVTEPIPGAGCGSANSDGIVTCSIPNGFGGITSVIGEVIKYFTYITALGTVLFIVINGVMYSMAGINEEFKSSAKERIKKTLIGLILLMLS